MKKSITLLLAGLGVLNAQAQNTCATAVAITAGTYTVAAIDGFEIPYPVCIPLGASATNGEWYSYVSDQDTSVTITTDLPVNAGGDTRVHVYTGGCAALTCEAGDDDSGTGYLSVVTFNVTAGVTYLIAFDDRWSDAGFDFMLTEHAPSASPINFTGVPITITGYADCVVDMNGDHLDDVVGVSSTNININHQLVGGGFNPNNIGTIAVATNHMPSWSIAAGDIDHNGYNDLMYGGSGGVSFMMANSTGTAFTEVSFPQYVFCQRTNMVDINSDGALDAFSCHDVDANVYYLNDGAGNLAFYQGGLGETCGNYGSIWIDFDNDGDMDLFVAKCGCDPVDILYRNNGDGTFTNVAASLGFADSHQSWSSAWGDYDNDGDMDVLVGSSSSSYHKLMRNNGDGTFTNATAGSGFDSFTDQSIEWTTHDFNNDGYLDILGGGAMMLNNSGLFFTPVTDVPDNGPIGDLNNDGFLDILNGSTIHMNNGNNNHWIKINTIGTTSNWNGIGARVEVTSDMGTQIRDVKSGDGFSFMSSLTTHFGLGADTQVDNVTIHWPSGIVDVIPAPAADATLNVVEGTFSAIEDISTSDLSIHPNPSVDVLYISSPDRDLAGSLVAVVDIAGKQVLTGTLRHGRLDISTLKSGVYLLQVATDKGLLQQRFAKQ